MAEAIDPNKANPPATSGGIDLKALTEAFNAAIKPIAEAQAALAQTLQQQAAAKAEAQESKADKGKQADAPKYLTAEDLAKVLDEREAARAAAAKKSTARDAVIAAKLKDVPEEFLAKLPDTDDAAKLNEAADAIIARVNTVLKPKAPNVGGSDGGEAAKAKAPEPPPGSLTAGASKYAQSIKLPA